MEIVFKKLTQHKLVRYIISGGSAAATQIGLLILFTDVFGIWYITSTTMAFCVAVFVSFLLQKFWTFQNKTRHNMHIQAAGYLVVAVIGLITNDLLLYFFVEYFHLHHIVGQIIGSGLIAILNYFLYRSVIFKHRPQPL
jgi:putative flippase GtrA